MRASRRALLGRACAHAAAALLALAGCRGPATAPTAGAAGFEREPVHLVVLHTNDVHGQVLPRHTARSGPEGEGGLPRVAAHVARVRGAEAGPRTAVLVLDGGDWFQGTPEGLLDGGAGFVQALAAVGYDALALGNHEFDRGLAPLLELLDDVRPPAIAANLRDPLSGERVGWVAPWRVVEAAGLSIALVGFVTTETPRITHPDASAIHFSDPVAEFGRVRAELAAGGGVDLVIPVGHIGVEDGERLAAAYPDLPLVVTGHSHAYLPEGRRRGRTLVVQAGEKATVVGRVDLWLDPESLAVLDSRARLDPLDRPVDAEHACAEVERLCAELAARAGELMGGVVGELGAPLTRGRGVESTVAGNWITDLMRARTGAEVAIHNRGGTRTELPAGPVTRRDVYELLPFDNDLVTVTLDGAALAQVVRQSLAGDGAGQLDFSGLEVRVRVGPQGPALESLAVAGEPLVAEARYTVTTNSYLARGGDGYALLAAAQPRRTDPILLRELVVEAFARTPRITPLPEERIAASPR